MKIQILSLCFRRLAPALAAGIVLSMLAVPARPEEARKDPWSLDRKVVVVQFNGVTVADALLALINDSGLRLGVAFYVDAHETAKRINLDLKDSDLGVLLDKLTVAGDPTPAYDWRIVKPYPRPQSRAELIEVWQRRPPGVPDPGPSPLDAVVKTFSVRCATPREALDALAAQVTEITGWKVAGIAPDAFEDPDFEPLYVSVSTTGESVKGILAKLARKADSSWVAKLDAANKSVHLMLGREFALPIYMEHNYVVKLQ